MCSLPHGLHLVREMMRNWADQHESLRRNHVQRKPFRAKEQL